MVVLSDAQLADVAFAAGFRGESLKIAVAVAIAESGGNASAVGDVSLEDAKWGPSIGLWQVRSVKAERGRGSSRDELALYDPSFNGRSAWSISGGGKTFKPWSMYTNGRYAKFLNRSTAVAANATGGSGAIYTADSPSTSGGGSSTLRGSGVYPLVKLDNKPVVPRTARSMMFRGKYLSELIGGDFNVSGDIEIGSSETPNISVTFVDPLLKILDAPWMSQKTPVDWEGWYLEIATVDLDEQNGIPVVNIGLWPRGIADMKKNAGESRSNVTPGEWVAFTAGKHGLDCLNFEGPAQVGTYGPSTDTGEDPESAWQTIGRLATESGCIFFVDPERVLVFGKPNNIAHGRPLFDVSWRNSLNDPLLDSTTLPKGHLLIDDATGGTLGASTSITLPRWRGEKIRAGFGMLLDGVPKFQGLRLVQKVRWRIDGATSDVSIDCIEPLNPKIPKKTSSTTDLVPVQDAGSSSSSGTLPHGTKSAADFVQFALNQAGDPYVFGANSTGADPNSFDCSSLVQWAAAQVGLSVPRNSNAQYAACDRITPAEAMTIRGALLFRPAGALGKDDSGHVVISLGDGRSTIEARGKAYGVGSFPITGRQLTQAGKIKGMIFGAGGAAQPATTSSGFGGGQFGGHGASGSW